MSADINIKEFINNIFDGVTSDERVCLSVTGGDGKFTNYPAGARRLERFRRGALPWYFCVSSVAPPSPDGYLGRRHQDLRYAYCLVLDDIGTSDSSKALTPPVEPSWILESSKDNYQWGYLLDPIELTPEALAHYEGCVRGLAVAGYSDPGARGAYRVMRVPGSLHKTGFVSRITSWEPTRFWDLAELMAAMGVEPVAQRVRRGVYAANGHADVSLCNDPVLDWLRSQGHIRDANSKWVHVRCPWEHEHTSDTGAQSTAFSPLGLGSHARAFSCLHGHCAERGLAEFLQWVLDEGGPDPDERTPRTIVPTILDTLLRNAS